MAPKKPRRFKRKLPWEVASQPYVSRAGNLVRVEFEYAPEKIRAIKSISSVKYEVSRKAWLVPIERITALTKSKYFGPESAIYSFPSEGAESATESSIAIAREAIRTNPFVVPSEALHLVTPDVVLRLAREKDRGVRALIRPGSVASKLLEKIPGVHYIKHEGLYYLPTIKLTEVVKKLRDKAISFGTDEPLGLQLKDTAALRGDILKGIRDPDSEDLEKALLVPYLDLRSEGDKPFTLKYATPEQQRLLGMFRSQKATEIEISEFELFEMIWRSESRGIPLFKTSKLNKQIDSRIDYFRTKLDVGVFTDGVLWILNLPSSFQLSTEGVPLFVADTKFIEEIRANSPGSLFEERKYIERSSRLLFELRPDEISDFIQEINDLGIKDAPISRGFSQFVQQISEADNERAEITRLKALGDIPAEDLAGLSKDVGDRLFPHQRIAVRFLVDRPQAFLGDDMGLGKTLSVLSAFSALQSEGKSKFLLVVCPTSLVRNWLREIENWFPRMKANALYGDKASKAWLLRLISSETVSSDVLIVNFESVRLDYVFEGLQKIASLAPTMLCVDESQRVKNPKALTFKALSKIAPLCERRVLLSGTPTPRDLADIWAQIFILDQGKRFGKSFYRWLGKIADIGDKFSAFAVKRYRPEDVKRAIGQVHQVLLRRTKEEVINLPEKTFTIREVELIGDQKKRYNEIREALLLRMRSVNGEAFVREITSILEEYLRAVQIASNPRLIDSDWKGEPAKFLELDEIIDEVVREREGKIVIWTSYLGNVSELVERYKDLGAKPFSGEVSTADRESTVRDFQSGTSTKVLVAIPAAGGVGITLTAANTAVYLDKGWNAEHWLQSIDRIHRIGQRGTVSIISLVASKIDWIIHGNLRKKERALKVLLGDVQAPKDKDRNFSDQLSYKELIGALDE